MRPLTKLGYILLAFVALASSSASAQENKQSGMRSRDIELAYDGDNVDKMRYTINKLIAVPALVTEEFKTGDEIRVALESNFDGFVYVLHASPGGKTRLLFPDPRSKDNIVRASVPLNLNLVFTKEPGFEVLKVYMSRQPIPLFDNTLKSAMDQSRSRVYLEGPALLEAEELARSVSKGAKKPPQSDATKDSAPALAQNAPATTRPRGVELYLGEDNTKKESIVAVEKENGDGHLKNNDIAFYEIRLKHN